MNSRWSNRRAGFGPALLLVILSLGCGKKDKPAAPKTGGDKPADPTQVEAELLGREAADIVDRVLAFKSAHQGNLPTSLRQAGLDSLTPRFIRRLGRSGNDPVISIIFRQTSGHQLSRCDGTSQIVEDLALRDGTFEVTCELAAGGRRTFTIAPPPPPPKSGS